MGQLVFVLLLFNLNILLFDNRPIILLLLQIPDILRPLNHPV